MYQSLYSLIHGITVKAYKRCYSGLIKCQHLIILIGVLSVYLPQTGTVLMRVAGSQSVQAQGLSEWHLVLPGDPVTSVTGPKVLQSHLGHNTLLPGCMAQL